MIFIYIIYITMKELKQINTSTDRNEKVDGLQKKHRANKRKNVVVTGSLFVALWASTLWTTSCNTTPSSERIAKDKWDIEMVSNQLSYLIEARKNLVRKYNDLLLKSQADPDNLALERSKSQVYDLIKDYNKDIERLGKKYIKKTKKLDNDVLKSQNANINPNQPIDENTYDYLLSMTN